MGPKPAPLLKIRYILEKVATLNEGMNLFYSGFTKLHT